MIGMLIFERAPGESSLLVVGLVGAKVWVYLTALYA